MKTDALLMAGMAASTIGIAAGCGTVDRLLGREQNPNHWLQQNQARIFQEEDVPDPEVEPFTHFAAGQLFEEKKQIHEAIVQYRKALELNPEFIGAYNRLAICLDKIGQHAEAESTFRQAIKVDPELAYLRNNLAFSLMAQRRWRDAERELRAALQLKPDYQRARVNLGITMSKLARREEAFRQFQMVLGEARAHYNIGMLDKAEGRYAQAAQSFRDAIALEPDLKAARVQLESLRRLAMTAPQPPRQQGGHVAPSRSTVAAQAAPLPVRTVQLAAQTPQAKPQQIVSAEDSATLARINPQKPHDAVIDGVAAVQADPDSSGMSIGSAEHPVFANEAAQGGSDFTWEVADLSAAAPGAAGARPTSATKTEAPTPKPAAKAPTVAAAKPEPAPPQPPKPVAAAPAKEDFELVRSPIAANSLPFLFYEEPCAIRNIGRFTAPPQPPNAPCAGDEFVDQFVLGQSGFELTPSLATTAPPSAVAADATGQEQVTLAAPDAWTAEEWRRFAEEHHLATEGSKLPSVLLRLRGDSDKRWQPRRTAGIAAPAPAMTNPAADIERSLTRAP